MLILERADELHRHVDECQMCQAGAKDAIFCYRGRVLLMAAASEALIWLDRAEESDAAARRQRPKEAGQSTQVPAKEPEARPDRTRPRQGRENGVHGALNRVGVRLGTVPAAAPEESAPATEEGSS